MPIITRELKGDALTHEELDANLLLASSGLERLEGPGLTGWRLSNKNSSNYSPIGRHAVDFSESDGPSVEFGASGDNSAAFGKDNIASGEGCLVSGGLNVCVGISSFVSGYGNECDSDLTTVCGTENLATGELSNVSGLGNTAAGLLNNVSGTYNTAAYDYQTVCGMFNDNKINTLYEIGNGTGALQTSNAFEVYQNGAVIAPELAPDIVDMDDQTLVPVSYLLSAEFGQKIPNGDPGEYGRIYRSNGALRISAGGAS